jgi:hypothetical protein
MPDLINLWLPIVASAVLVFVASSLIHMVLQWHKGDYPKLPNEDAVADALRPLGLVPGDYMLPRAGSFDEFKKPEFLAKMTAGPNLILTVLPQGLPSMPKMLGQWFIYCLVVSVFAAYIASLGMAHGGVAADVACLAGVTAFAGYSLALLQMSIWYRRSWRVTLLSIFDGLIYAVITGATFAFLWH